MCGISGIFGKDGPVAEERIRKITDLVSHRGPDDSGYYSSGSLAFGHRRLSIIDLGARGRQPMCFGGRYWITYNGEVYNYLELREELQKLGVQFHTTTDTEVILAAYAQWGAACLKRFNGMWAFAIHDQREGTVFMARDRFGVKPFYYTESGTEFVFGSEIKQLIALQPRVRANQRMVVESLLTYFDGHTDETLFEGVKLLPQAHYMIYRLATNTHTLHRYYELAVDPRLARISLKDGVETFRHLFEDAIRLRLRSDVTVGTCLSGGLDSSATSVLAASAYHAATGRRFTAIHAKSIEAGTDESAFARAVARHADLELFVVEPSTQDFVATIDEVVHTQEEPFGSPSMFMGWHVFREAKARNCKVMLNGQGGDEVLLGYERYYAAFLRSASMLQFLKQLYLQSRNSRLRILRVLQYYLYFTNPALRIRRLKARSCIKAHIKAAHDFGHVRLSAASFASIVDLQVLEIGKLQLPHLLRYEDRNSMRHSIETRLPFLDYRLVETAVSLPADFKIRDGWTKYVLRQAVDDVLPKEIVWRTNKLGFEAPERIWLTEHEPEMKREISASRMLGEIADRERILNEYAHLSLKERWAYFNLAVWERVYNVSWA